MDLPFSLIYSIVAAEINGLSLSSFDVKSTDTYLFVSNQSDCII